MNSATILITLFFAFVRITYSQPNWQWSKNAVGLNSENGNSICTDVNGNVFVTGYFYSSTISFGTYTLTNKGNYDFFIVKYNSTGNVMWAKSGGGIYDDTGLSVTADNSGNAIITGYYYSPLLVAGSYTLTNAGVGDIFVIKYDASGNEILVKNIGGSFDDNGNGVTTDSAGNIFVCGFFTSPSLTIDSYTLTNSGNSDAFVCKLNSAGNVIWATNFSGGGNDAANNITSDPQGNCYITGHFYSSVLSIGSLSLTSAGSSDIFTVKLAANGNETWANSAGGSLNDAGYGVASDASGNTYVTGNFLSSTLTANSHTLMNAGNYDMALIKYNNAGNAMWIQSGKGIFDETGLSVACEGQNSIYVTGHFHSPSITLNTFTLNNAGVGDGYLAKYDSTGTVLWTEKMGGSNDDGSNGVAVDATGSVHITGFFNSPDIIFSSDTLINSGLGDVFTAKLAPFITSVTTMQEEKNEIALYPNPSGGNFIFYSDNTMELIEIYNSTGIMIYSEKIHNSVHKIDLNGFPGGIYSAHILIKEKILLKKVILY